MNDKIKKDEEVEKKTSKKKKYTPPTIESEELNTYGALCNGTSTGGRKVTASPVPAPFCNPSRLNS